MGQLLDYLSDKKKNFKGNPKDLDKFTKKVATFIHAPTTDKHTKRMLPFAENSELISFVNQQLKDYFIHSNEFKEDENGWKNYDIIASWYLFTVLVYSKKVEDTVVFILERMKASKNSDLFLLRRIFHLCTNPVYEKQFTETEEYFSDLSSGTSIYRWLNELGVTPPISYNWALIFRLKALSTLDTNRLSDNVFLTVKGFEPEGNGESFKIELSDRERNVQTTWNDFSEEDYFYFKQQKIQLKKVPNIFTIMEFIVELEEIYEIKFERKYDFSYFAKGFKKKEIIQKWLLR
ncbi:MAG: hypothetical protein ACO1N0_17610 [Fluviicola sp.]